MIHRLSKIYWPLSVIPKDAIIKNEKITSKSQKLLLELGLIKSTGNGTFHLLPILQKSLDKCIKLIEQQLNEINCQKLTLPILTSSLLWKKSGRLNNDLTEFFTLKDHNEKIFILSPTHEESITSLLSLSSPISYKQLPLKLYQIGIKFRDELKPRFGLIRTKEFLMKDLYSFDCNINNAKQTYNEINNVYEKLFNKLELPWIKVNGSTGIMGGDISHEYHIISKIGEDNLLNCLKCNFSSNSELYENNLDEILKKCPNCNNNSSIQINKGIEIAHTFLLGDKYSKPLKATFLKSNNQIDNLIMGCYGIGITRLLSGSIEILSTENEIRWPTLLAPFKYCIIPPKNGSKEENISIEWLNCIINELIKIYNNDDILLDDRTNLTIGKRLMDCKKLGFPKIIVIGNKIMNENPKFELYCLKTNTRKDLELSQLLKEFHNENEIENLNRNVCN